MKIAPPVVTLLLLFCGFLLAENKKETPSPAKHPSSPKAEDCASVNRKSAYDLSPALPHTRAAAKFYDVDYAEPYNHPHDPVCLSVKAGDVIVWYTSKHKPFKLKISRMSGDNDCRSHPFDTSPPSAHVLGHYSGPPRPNTEGCVYAVEFERDGKTESDPHIRIGP